MKVLNFASVYAAAITVLVAGLAQDYVIGLIRRAVCPYAVAA